MVDGVAVGAGPPLGQSLDEFIVGHVDVDRDVDVDLRREGVRLLDGPGESVEDDLVESLDLLLHESDDEVVGYESSGVHVGLRFESELGPVPDSLAQHVTGGQLGVSEVVAHLLCLSSLSAARRAEEYYLRFHEAWE